MMRLRIFQTILGSYRLIIMFNMIMWPYQHGLNFIGWMFCLIECRLSVCESMYELCSKNDDQIMQKNDLSVFSFNLNWRETPDEFVASDVVPSGKHLSHKLRTGANAYEHDHSEFLMWPQCKKAFGLSISIFFQRNEASWQVGSLNFTKLAEEYRTPTAEEAA